MSAIILIKEGYPRAKMTFGNNRQVKDAALLVVISDIPIFNEVVGDPGVYFDPTDSNMLAERILNLADDPEYKREKSVAARKRARSKFSLERTAEEYYNIYKEVVEENT